jgi:hypothetical protein
LFRYRQHVFDMAGGCTWTGRMVVRESSPQVCASCTRGWSMPTGELVLTGSSSSSSPCQCRQTICMAFGVVMMPGTPGADGSCAPCLRQFHCGSSQVALRMLRLLCASVRGAHRTLVLLLVFAPSEFESTIRVYKAIIIEQYRFNLSRMLNADVFHFNPLAFAWSAVTGIQQSRVWRTPNTHLT